METNIQPDLSARAGTAGGIILALLLQLSTEELLKTMILAAVGAIVSFTVSKTLKWLWKNFHHK
jgi:uncharacterized membrane protein (DUF4010 family)